MSPRPRWSAGQVPAPAVGLLQRLIVLRDAAPLRDAGAEDLAGVAWLLAELSERLLARRFATPDDVGITPFLTEVRSRLSRVPELSADDAGRLIRATLDDGLTSDERLAESITLLHLALVLQLAEDTGLSGTDIAELLDDLTTPRP